MPTRRRLLLARRRAAAAALAPALAQGTLTLLNVSYDPTREFYREYNAAFAARWRAQTGQAVRVNTSHGGSGRQARSVIDGLQADVLTLALSYDIDAVAERGLLAKDWMRPPAAQQRALYQHHRLPRAEGQPEGPARLGRPGAARHRGHHAQPQDLRRRALELPGGLGLGAAPARRQRRQRPRTIVTRLFRNVPVLDTGARGSTTTFAQRGLGDVLLAWENEAHLAIQEFGADKFDIVYPSLTILAEPSVAVVDRMVDRRGTRAVAEAYLQGLYTPEGQALAAKHFYRPRDPAVLAANAARFPAMELVTVDETSAAGRRRRAPISRDGGVFDRVARAAPVSASTRPAAARRARAGDPGLPARPSAITLLWLGTIVLIPLAALALRPLELGPAGLVASLADERVLAALRLSFGGALLAALLNLPLGLLLAWAVVRLRFPGPRHAGRGARPALRPAHRRRRHRADGGHAPNGWIGAPLEAMFGWKIAFTRAGVVLALMFVGLPFIVRTVEPVLRDMAARGRGGGGDARRHARRRRVLRVVLPGLLPALLTGFALAFARAVGEYGSVIFIAGNLPMLTEIAPLLIVIRLEQFDYARRGGGRAGDAGAVLRRAAGDRAAAARACGGAGGERRLPPGRAGRALGAAAGGGRRRSSSAVLLLALPLAAVFTEALRRGVPAALEALAGTRTRWRPSG